MRKHSEHMLVVVAALIGILVGPVAAASAPLATAAPSPMESMLKPGAAPEAEAVAQAFQDALQHGDRTKALELLVPSAQISEGGETQNVEEYAAHHLGADIAFLKNAKVTLLSRTSMRMGESAHVASESRVDATSKGKPLKLRSQEQMQLQRIGDKWKITSIAWSSQQLSE